MEDKFKYRPDIDGLRAIAVLLVVFSHAFPEVLESGFIGVDIFFVISGFLISTIMFQQLESGTFQLKSFYARRIKRIFPALIVVLLCFLIVGWLTLLPNEYAQLGLHVVAGALFSSNLLLNQELGYFDTESELKPLLHLWSLGIEEQFYIIWPILLLLIWRKQKCVLPLLIIILSISFYLSIHDSQHHLSSTFYLPQYRFWELLSGAFLAKIKQKMDQKLNTAPRFLFDGMSLAGAALLIFGLVHISASSVFPGFWALVPVISAVTFIGAGPTAVENKYFLSSHAMVAIGLISYPLYLWHWPILSFLKMTHIDKLSLTTRLTAVFVSFLLAALTYLFIEKRLRYQKSPWLTLRLITTLTCIGLFGSFVKLNQGLPFRDDKSAFADYYENSLPEMRYFARINALEFSRDQCSFFNFEMNRLGKTTQIPRPKIDPSCYERNPRFEKSLLIWGDSHAQQLYGGLKNKLDKSWQILQVASSGCPPRISDLRPSQEFQCMMSNWFAIETIKNTKPDVVIVAQRDGQSIEEMNGLSEFLKRAGAKNILFVGQTPHWNEFLPRIVMKHLWTNIPRSSNIGLDKSVIDRNQQISQNVHPSGSVKFANVIQNMCNESGCLVYIGNDVKTGLTSYDYGHLTPIASDFVAETLLVPIIYSFK